MIATHTAQSEIIHSENMKGYLDGHAKNRS
jgi:hypothetical protein